MAFEPLWVLAPVRGLSVRREVKVGVVDLVDGDAGREMLRRFVPPLDAQFSDPLADVGAFARVAVPAKYLYDAEREGLSLIDDATAWLTTRLRYSWSHGPDQRLEPYERATTLVVVERLPGVAVFPVEGTGRRWWRDTTFAQRERYVELAPDARWLAPPMPTQVSPSDRQALLALQRAVAARDPVQRVVALWEAIEFYVGDRSPEAQFTDAEVKGAIGRAREGLTGAKAERVGNLLRNLLNSWPILARFEQVLHAEGVPYTDEDRTRIKAPPHVAQPGGPRRSGRPQPRRDRPGGRPHEPGAEHPLEPPSRVLASPATRVVRPCIERLPDGRGGPAEPGKSRCAECQTAAIMRREISGDTTPEWRRAMRSRWNGPATGASAAGGAPSARPRAGGLQCPPRRRSPCPCP